MMKRLSRAAGVLGGLMLIFSAGPTFAESRTIGLLGLYQGDAIMVDEAAVSDLGCSIHRRGVIGAAQGDIGLAEPNQFLLLACDTTVLGDAGKREGFAALANSHTALAVLEGNLADFSNPDAGGALSDRQYILKVSTYNNADVNRRDHELAALNTMAGQRKDTYVTESFVSVNHAMGMPTPDEVVVLYYKNSAAGDRFRQQNGDIMTAIGAFNKEHLVNFVYYVGQGLK